MARVLILFAHPALDKSRVHARMIRNISQINGVRLHDLYEIYPDFDIDPKNEQELLLEHDVIIWQHPFYWYSAPALVKQWMDLVLEHNWAYGNEGNKLSGKIIFNAITTGGREASYAATGHNHYTIQQLLAPFEQTARLCKMLYLPPFVIHGTHRLSANEIALQSFQYEQLLKAFAEDRVSESEYRGLTHLNDIVPGPESFQT